MSHSREYARLRSETEQVNRHVLGGDTQQLSDRSMPAFLGFSDKAADKVEIEVRDPALPSYRDGGEALLLRVLTVIQEIDVTRKALDPNTETINAK